MVGLLPIAVTAAGSSPALASTSTKQQSNGSEAHDLTPAPSTCPARFACETIPSSTGSSGGIVDGGPTQNIGDTQWVYFNLYQFTPGTYINIAYCTDTAALSVAAPLCVASGYVLSANPAPQYATEIQADGTQNLSFEALEIDSSNDPFQGQEPGEPDVKGTFYCNATSPCSIDVIDSGVDGLGDSMADADNTAVFPITFATPFSGCGGSSANVTTESEYGIEFLLPVASAAACALPDPTLAFNTAQDGLGAVTSLSSGAAAVAFTDNPESSEQQQVLKQGNYKLIPIALTANVVGFKAEQNAFGKLYPVSTMDLTPNMAAGLLTGIYNTPQSADEVTCSTTLGCPSFGGQVCTTKAKVTTCTPAPCPYHVQPKKPKGPITTCSLFAQVNFQQDFAIAQQYEAFVRSDDAGSVGLAFDWLCNAPVVPVTVDIPQSSGAPYVATYSDDMSAAQLLKDGFGTPTQPLKSCPSEADQYPPEPLGATVEYTGYADPNEQVLKMLSYVQPGLQGGNATAAFASMNWTEAQYYGLQIAALENGGGAFVTPSATSLDAAVNDATTNADGTLKLNYAANDPNAYPMTSVIYAAVCGDAETTQTATNITNMLTQVLDVSGSSSTATLPEGFVPLTAGLTQTAQADIAKDVVGGASTDAYQSGCPASSAPGSKPPASTAPSSSSPAPVSSAAPSSAHPNSTGVVPTVSGTGTGAGSASAGSSSQSHIAGHPTAFGGLSTGPPPQSGSGQGSTGSSQYLQSLTLASSSSRIFLPLALLLGLLAIVLGAFVAFSPTLRAQLIGVARGTSQRVGSAMSKLGARVSSWARGLMTR